MEPTTQRWTREESDRAAREYMASLPPEHFMEAEPQAFQRQITVHSLEVVASQTPQFRHFNELAIQVREGATIWHVVPDNMAVLGPLDPRTDRTCFSLALEQSPVFWVLEYVSRNSKRKDYVGSFGKYERLGIRYYLTFDPEELDLRLFRHDGQKYVQLKPDDEGRYPIPELELEVGMMDGWVHFWLRGELIPLSAELVEQVQQARRERDEARAEVQRKEKQLRRKDRQLEKKDEQIQKKDEQLQIKEQQLQTAVNRLRSTVQRMAQRAGREDILSAVAEETDLVRLNGWVDELA